MTATVTKFVTYGLTGKSGLNVSKFVGYVLLEPGSSSGSDTTPVASYTYGQVLRPAPGGCTGAVGY